MANGTIAFDTLSTSGQISGTAVSVDTDYLAYGSAKGWIHVDQLESNAVRESFNMSFVTDEGSGESMVGITNPMANVHYVIHVTGSTNRIGCIDSNTATTSQFSIEFDADADGSRNDTHHGMTTFHGDLA